MKKLSFLAMIAFVAFSCNNTPTEPVETAQPIETAEVATYEYFGDSTMTAADAIPSTELMAHMAGKDSVEVKVIGTVASVCQKKGCWMSVEVDNGESMHVTYNYEFLLPMNCAGKEMVMNGTAFYDTIPVDHLKHLAEDAGKTAEEIEAITAPKATLAFLASSVMIKK